MGSKKLRGLPKTQASQLDPTLRYAFLEYGTQNATQASGLPEFTQVGAWGSHVYRCLSAQNTPQKYHLG